MNITAANLNLFVVFGALLEERNVTRAAGRIGISQPALSSSLGQLRTMFNDRLFVRSGREMQPTPKALELATPVRRGLEEFRRALAGTAGFDPASSDRTFVLAAGDIEELLLVTPLIDTAGREAPATDFVVKSWMFQYPPEELAAGTTDLLLGYVRTLPPGHEEEVLFEEKYVCLVRRNHPKVKRTLTLETYLELPHVMVSQVPGEPGAVDRVLDRQGRKRRVRYRTAHFLTLPNLIASSDMIVATPSRLAKRFAPEYGLRVLELPLKVPGSRVSMVWHTRMNDDPGHRWLRERVRRAARALK